jgi:hypothetical protein
MWHRQIAPIVVALALAAATAALGAEPPAAPTDATAKPPETAAKPDKPPRPKEVCTREVETGSHQVTRVCRTQDVIDAERKNAKDLMNQRRGPTSPVILDKPPTGR